MNTSKEFKEQVEKIAKEINDWIITPASISKDGLFIKNHHGKEVPALNYYSEILQRIYTNFPHIDSVFASRQACFNAILEVLLATRFSPSAFTVNKTVLLNLCDYSYWKSISVFLEEEEDVYCKKTVCILIDCKCRLFVSPDVDCGWVYEKVCFDRLSNYRNR